MLVKIRQVQSLNNFVFVVKHGTRKYSSCVANTNDKPNEPIYPPISDMTLEGKIRAKREVWMNKIRKLVTVEEKLFDLNMPRYYGWRSALITEHSIPYNCLPFAQYVTRTYVARDSGLPNYYDKIISSEALDSIIQTVKPLVEENIIFEHCFKRRNNESNVDKSFTNTMIHGINRILLSNLSLKMPHLLEAEIDFDPRVEAFWFVGGISPLRNSTDSRYINTPFQYLGNPILHLRHSVPLPEIMLSKLSENFAQNVSERVEYVYDPRTLGYYFRRRYATNVPGFWPGDPCEFGLLSYHNCEFLNERQKYYDDTDDAYIVQAIYACYSWLLSQACYQGFSTFHDLTYPLVTQAVITNGYWWSFFVYQMNTTLLHSENVDNNSKCNMCWMTGPMKLFEKVEGENIYEFNDEVLRMLVKFYANTPQKRKEVVMKPYLGKTIKIIADIKSNERREWLEKQYKHFVSNRKRHRPIPEMKDWQKIYKTGKTRNLLFEKKRDPWEYGIKPMRRRLNDHAPPYVPRCLRANPKRRKIDRYGRSHYPIVNFHPWWCSPWSCYKLEIRKK